MFQLSSCLRIGFCHFIFFPPILYTIITNQHDSALPINRDHMVRDDGKRSRIEVQCDAGTGDQMADIAVRFYLTI